MSETDPFDDPGSTGGGKYPSMAQLKGRLLLIEPTALAKNVPGMEPGKFVDRITATVGVIDGKEPITDVLDKDGDSTFTFDEPLVAPFELEDLYISQVVLVNQLRKAYKAETKVLGRLVQLPAREKGRNKAWGLEAPTDEDKTAAREYLANKPTDDPWS
jgi:hypothetical protein